MNLSNKRYGDTDEPRWLADNAGETSEAIALHEWSATPLGPLTRWPQSLRTAVGICLGSRFPMALWWGNELIQIYNDAYRHILGDKHPRSLGQNASACWAEIWNTVGPMAANVMATGDATWFEDLLLVINRFGYIEEAYFTVSFSSVRAESGAVAGVLMTCVETTERVLGERRLATLRDLAAHSGDGKTAEEAADIAANILAANPFDVPFALLYLIDAPGKVARLAGWLRLPPSWPAAAAAIALDESAGAAQLWPLGDALRTERTMRVDLSSAQLQNLPGGQWPEAPQTALILPIPGGSQGIAGALVIGISPRRALDEAYRGFCELIARQIGTSVTHARAYQEERRRAEALAEIDRRKAEFLANMSHEIRSPMTSILGYADVLLAHLKNPDNIECVKTIKQSGNYLLEIINDILDLSKIESGKLQVGKEWLSLPTLLAEIHALMAVRANEKHLPLILKYDGAVPEMIESDRTRLRQILINLISNAIKFTDHGKVEIVTQFVAPQNVLRIEVRDTGIGISAEQQERLFLPFTQADSSLARAHGGTGLGLAITKRLVDMLGGNISFETRERFGTTFRVEIPSGPMDDTRKARAGAQWSSRTARAAGARLGCRVLAVDDRREIQYLIRHFLEEAGAEVTTVSDGYGAIAAVKDGAYDVRPFDIVIMDIQMPGLDGYQTTRQMRAQGFSKPIIGLSAGAMKGDREKCLEAGCNDYLSKPIDAEALVKLVAQHIAQTSSEVAMREPSHQKILLVDDHQVACKSTAILLEMAGHEVRTAFNGRTALEIAREFSPDVVILDIGLPDIGGYELLSRLKQYDQLAGAKFIALTGYEEESARRDDLGVDFHHFLRKPVDTSQLKALLQDC